MTAWIDAEREDEAIARSIHDEELEAMREDAYARAQALEDVYGAERDEPGRDYAADGYGEE